MGWEKGSSLRAVGNRDNRKGTISGGGHFTDSHICCCCTIQCIIHGQIQNRDRK